MLSYALRGAAVFCLLILLAFAWLQINDPDPVLWTGYYLLCAFLPLLIIFNRFNRPLFWLTTAITLVVIGIYVPGTIEYLRHANTEPLMQSMNPEKPYIEEAREFIGGVITLAILLTSRWLHHLQRQR